MRRILNFIRLCVRMRSISLALWVRDYDRAKVAE
ncbi:MAG: hypothetical protein BWY63_02884 [Chloroflexi bacterium ADurb.Bin360]|nr:MAG: hypothetical protein BWY63_02884 [Chloroflexi bacterium ADurb.Bin360]